MKRILLIISSSLILVLSTFAQESYSIAGTIYDADTGETLIGASVFVKEILGSGTTCNEYGYYSISVPRGKYTLIVSFVGCKDEMMQLDLTSDRRLDFKLKSDAFQFREVVVTGEKRNENIVSDDIGVESLSVHETLVVPVLLGEKDVIKTLTLSPGVKTSGEGSGGMFVRGGSNSQNLILLDEAIVYNSSHLLGFFSTFNSDAIKGLSLYKGTAPAQYGGRLSSVMDIKMNEGNNREYKIGGGLGLISSKLSVEGPIVQDEGSFLITGRRSYADLFLKLSKDEKLNDNELYFYDLNLKANYRLNENSRIYLSAFMGRDVLAVSDRFGIDWGNVTATLRYNHIWSNKLFSNSSLIYSDYDYKASVNLADNEFAMLSKINNWNFKQDFQYFLNSKNTFFFGLFCQYNTITPGQTQIQEGSNISSIDLPDRNSIESGFFFSNDWRPSDSWRMTYGVRLNMFNLFGGGDFYKYDNAKIVSAKSYASNEIVKSYYSIEPRLNLAFIIDEANSLKISYTKNTQNLHLIQSTTSSSPQDSWITSSENVKPEISHQVSLGYFRNFLDDEYQFSTESYYKWMYNQLDLRNGANVTMNEHVEGELLFGEGRAYGIEFLLKKKRGVFTGWLSYTLSRTERKIDKINNGDWYAARQDATHDVSIVGILALSDSWTLSSSWVYSTGNAVTFPSGKYQTDADISLYYSERNGYRMPAYNRLDIGATWFISKTADSESSLNFSVYNAYGRKNAYSIDFEEHEDDATRTVANKTYLFTFMPSVTYNFKF